MDGGGRRYATGGCSPRCVGCSEWGEDVTDVLVEVLGSQSLIVASKNAESRAHARLSDGISVVVACNASWSSDDVVQSVKERTLCVVDDDDGTTVGVSLST